MPSLSFDPVAHAYDASRGYPEGVARQIAAGIAAAVKATPQTKFLEIGIGTGRIAYPLASLGHNYTGVDISEKMVEQLEAKLVGSGWREILHPWGYREDEKAAGGGKAPVARGYIQVEQWASLRLVMADMTDLPFYDDAFDIALAVHVFHLVDGWQKAVGEALRVLRRGGYFLHCWDERSVSEERNVGKAWENIVTELGGEVKRPGASSAHSDVTHWLREQGLQSEESIIARWETTMTPRRALENVTKRLWSSTWTVPDDLFAVSVERL
ncbi:MAG TPA: class I SAM-dependent methyltransferase, partial [Ktedonobacteraceae bacterium]